MTRMEQIMATLERVDTQRLEEARALEVRMLAEGKLDRPVLSARIVGGEEKIV